MALVESTMINIELNQSEASISYFMAFLNNFEQKIAKFCSKESEQRQNEHPLAKLEF